MPEGLTAQQIWTVVAAGVGAFIANFAAEWIKAVVRRSQLIEQNRDQDLAEILSSVAEMQTSSEEYWTQSAAELGSREMVLRAKIVSRQTHILRLVSSLFSGAVKREADVAFTAVMNAASGGAFGEPDRTAEAGRLTEIYQRLLAFSRVVTVGRRDLRRRFLA